jgi:ABC-2 type transport system ATP-binding protein
MLLGVIAPDQGSFRWFGESPSKEVRKRIGAILETPNFYPYLSAARNLRIVAEIKGKGKSRISEVLERVNLYDRRKDKFKTYSLGMKQRLAIAAALLNEPEVLVLDEPTNGLDPQGIAEIRELITSIASEGTTILLASHILDEVEKVCTDVAVLKRGRLLFAGKVDQISGEKQATLVEVRAEDMSALEVALQGLEGIQSLRPKSGSFELTLTGDLSSEALNRQLFERGITLSLLHVRRMSLEQQFLEITA